MNVFTGSMLPYLQNKKSLLFLILFARGKSQHIQAAATNIKKGRAIIDTAIEYF